MRIAILGITLSVLAQAAMAQSVLTLDDFDLGDDLAEVKPAPTSEMEDCLLNNADCVNREYKSGSDLSLDDVVNLGIVDHESVPTTVSTEGAVASVPVSKTAPLPSIDIEILVRLQFRSGPARSIRQAVGIVERVARVEIRWLPFCFPRSHRRKGWRRLQPRSFHPARRKCCAARAFFCGTFL